MFNALKKKLFGEGPNKLSVTERPSVPMSPEEGLAEAEKLVSQGNALLDQGKPGQAAECYRRATELNPAHAGAFINLGFALSEQGRHAEAVAPLRQAIALDPRSVDAHYILGTSQKECAEVAAAIDSYLKTIELKPDFVSCRLELCRLLASSGKAEQARQLITDGIALAPEVADLHFYLANLMVTAGDVGGAIGSFRNALAIDPNHRPALSNLGLALHAAGDYDAAIESYEQAIALAPDDPAVHCSLAVTLLAQGRSDAGERHCRMAIAIDPEHARAHCALATSLQQRGEIDEAIEHYRIAVSIDPRYVDALNNLGTMLQAKERYSEAIDLLQRALAIDDKLAAAHNNLGNAFYRTDRLEEAVACFKRALAINPDYVDALGNLGGLLQEQCLLDESMAYYKKAIALKADFADAQSNLLFTVNYHPDLSAEEVFAHYRDYDRRVGLPLRPEAIVHLNSRDTARRLRVGYVSPDFRQHSVRHFLEPLMDHHDHSAVEVFAYAELAQDDDAMTARYRGHVDHWVPTRGLSDDALAQRVRDDRIDILVDLAGHTAKNRLGVFARKPAPVSISWLGFGSTTGLSAIDYLMTDEVCAPPGSEGLFAEQPWRLAVPGFAYRPAEGMGPEGSLPALQRGFVTFGTLTRAVRVNHRTVRVWSRILQAVPGSHLVVDSRSYQDAAMRSRLVSEFVALGISPERLEIGFHSPPWDVLRGLDVGLDCFPHNSGTTLFESLYMGVPFVTLADRPSVGRLGSSILRGLGHAEWIASDEDDYVEIAVALAGDLAALTELRSRLRGQMETGPLCDEAGFARKVESAYRTMFERWATGSAGH